MNTGCGRLYIRIASRPRDPSASQSRKDLQTTSRLNRRLRSLPKASWPPKRTNMGAPAAFTVCGKAAPALFAPLACSRRAASHVGPRAPPRPSLPLAVLAAATLCGSLLQSTSFERSSIERGLHCTAPHRRQTVALSASAGGSGQRRGGNAGRGRGPQLGQTPRNSGPETVSLDEFMAQARGLDDEKETMGRVQVRDGRKMSAAPGDWICPECGVMVFASKNVCFRCRASKPAALGSSGRSRDSEPGAYRGHQALTGGAGLRVQPSSDFSRKDGGRPHPTLGPLDRHNMDAREGRRSDLMASGGRVTRGRGRGARGGRGGHARRQEEDEAEKGSAQALWKARIRNQKEEQRRKNLDAAAMVDIDGGFFQKRVSRAKGRKKN